MYLYTFRKTNKIQQVAWLENVKLTGQKWSSKFFFAFSRSHFGCFCFCFSPVGFQPAQDETIWNLCKKEKTEVCGQLKNIRKTPSQDTMVHPRVFLSLCRCLKSGPQPRDHNLSSHRIFLLPLPYYCLPSSGELQHKNHCFFPKMNHPQVGKSSTWVKPILFICPSFITKISYTKTTYHLWKGRSKRSVEKSPRPQLSWVEFTKQGPPPTTVSSSRWLPTVFHVFPLPPTGVMNFRRVEKWGYPGYITIYYRGGLGGRVDC